MHIYRDQFGRLIADHGLGAHYVQPQHIGSLGGLGQFTTAILPAPSPMPPPTQMNVPPWDCPPPYTMQGATACCNPASCVPIETTEYVVECQRLAKNSDQPGLVYEKKKFKGRECPSSGGWEKVKKGIDF